jgi:hypothetical protein
MASGFELTYFLPPSVPPDEPPILPKSIKGTSYIAPVKRENEKISSFVKTASYKTVLILGTLLL